jgi:hypothetical protein
MSITPEQATEEIKDALRSPDGSIKVVQTFTHGKAVQVMRKTRKIGPLIIPNREGGQSLGDVLSMLGEWAEGES